MTHSPLDTLPEENVCAKQHEYNYGKFTGRKRFSSDQVPLLFKAEKSENIMKQTKIFGASQDPKDTTVAPNIQSKKN